MKLKELIKDLKVEKITPLANPDISGISYDSRRVKEGYLFVAIRGFKDDGHRYLSEALEHGARAVIVEKDTLLAKKNIAKIRVKDSRVALAILSSNFYHAPSEHLKVIGVTGTNGKTTVTYLLEAILKKAGYRTGLIGTITYKIGDRIIAAHTTTPESLELESLLAELVREKSDYLVMEVSSHSLTQHRVEKIEFDAAIFTNLAKFEHLDYHHRMKEYLSAKLSLFQKYLAESPKKEKRAIINIDDPFASSFLKAARINKIKVITYGMKGGDVRARNYLTTELGASFKIESLAGNLQIFTKLMGKFNLYNILAAVSFGIAEGINLELVKEGIEGAETIPGRLEPVDCGQPFKVLVDYAHTESALRNLLLFARELPFDRILLIFGCGGDRDRRKRPLMGKIAAKFADFSIITSDNPRSEEPESIIKEIEKGIRRGYRKKYKVVVDREEAIREGIAKAEKGDLLLIAGKGHETYQILKDTIIPFDDRLLTRKILENMGKEEARAVP
ncbi:MAG: UDP-N-acetylmuramoyl-L-alanyl-D-glutamate--2,6-diaminopimelate ligase [Candidatus Omnitrophica bacterium]|nr:UDP-N-acetylmuramoyl-L-alanyl-D-glutamate--2,6-diaminopimelate ligase [Candidatus Omnitrophota bacterium]